MFRGEFNNKKAVLDHIFSNILGPDIEDRLRSSDNLIGTTDDRNTYALEYAYKVLQEESFINMRMVKRILEHSSHDYNGSTQRNLISYSSGTLYAFLNFVQPIDRDSLLFKEILCGDLFSIPAPSTIYHALIGHTRSDKTKKCDKSRVIILDILNDKNKLAIMVSAMLAGTNREENKALDYLEQLIRYVIKHSQDTNQILSFIRIARESISKFKEIKGVSHDQSEQVIKDDANQRINRLYLSAVRQKISPTKFKTDEDELNPALQNTHFECIIKTAENIPKPKKKYFESFAAEAGNKIRPTNNNNLNEKSVVLNLFHELSLHCLDPNDEEIKKSCLELIHQLSKWNKYKVLGFIACTILGVSLSATCIATTPLSLAMSGGALLMGVLSVTLFGKNHKTMCKAAKQVIDDQPQTEKTGSHLFNL